MENKVRKSVDIIAPNLSGKGGTETVISYLLNSKIIGTDFSFNILLTGINSDKTWLKNKKNLKRIFSIETNSSIKKAIKSMFFYLNTKSDFVLSTGPGQTRIAYIIKKIFRKKYILISWIHFSAFGADNINYKYLKYADYHLAISSEIEKQLISLGIDKNKIKRIYNPVLSSNHRIYRSCDNTLRLVYIGRIQLYKQKNLNEMLLGLKMFNSSSEDWILNIYGGGEVDDIKRLASKMGILKHIIFHGWVKEPWKNISVADTLLLTSNYEGFGMVLAEAVSRGVPCISSDCPVGPRDIIKNGINGYLYEPRNIKDFYSKLTKVNKNESFKNTIKISKSINYLYDEKYDKRFIESLYYFSGGKDH